MARLKGSDGSLQQVDANLAARVALTHPFTKDADGGRYRLSLVSGLLTTIAAYTSSAGHLAMFRNPSATKTILVDRVRVFGSMVTDFTTLQALILQMRKCVGITALHSAGGAAIAAGDGVKKRESMAASILDGYAANTTTAVSGGTIATQSNVIARAIKGEPSDGATVGNIPIDLDWKANEENGPIILAQNDGLLVANEVLMGAAGTLRLAFELNWREVLNADAAGL